MSDQVEIWRAMREHRKQAHTKRRDEAPTWLASNNIPFVSHNGGTHLVITAGDSVIDYWPGTSRWIVRGEKRPNFGHHRLLSFVRKAGRLPG